MGALTAPEVDRADVSEGEAPREASEVPHLRAICSGLCLLLFHPLASSLAHVAGGNNSQSGWPDFKGSGQIQTNRKRERAYGLIYCASGDRAKKSTNAPRTLARVV
jgi:hypothetical protein